MPHESTERPALTADVVLIADGEQRSVLLVQRRYPPFEGAWALPGGFVERDEEPVRAALRELAEETGVRSHAVPVLVDVFGKQGRDPRGWTVTVAYAVVEHGDRPQPTCGDDANAAQWWPLDALPVLAFDHAEILASARARLGL